MVKFHIPILVSLNIDEFCKMNCNVLVKFLAACFINLYVWAVEFTFCVNVAFT